MIKHVVLVKVKPGTSQEQIDAMVAGYNSLKDAIPELASWSMGPNLRDDSRVLARYGRRCQRSRSAETLR